MRVAAEHLDDVAVAAGCEQEFPVGRDGEVARVRGGGLVARRGQRAVFFVDGEYGYPVTFQAVAGIEETAVGAEVDVRAAACMEVVGDNGLCLLQLSVGVAECRYHARKFVDEVGVPPVGRKGQVARARTGFHFRCRAVGQQAVSPLCQTEAEDAVGAEVAGKQVTPVGREGCAMYVRGDLPHAVHPMRLAGVLRQAVAFYLPVAMQGEGRQTSAYVVGRDDDAPVGRHVARGGPVRKYGVFGLQLSARFVEQEGAERGGGVVHLVYGIHPSAVGREDEERGVRRLCRVECQAFAALLVEAEGVDAPARAAGVGAHRHGEWRFHAFCRRAASVGGQSKCNHKEYR